MSFSGSNTSRRSNTSAGAPNSSHRTVHMSLERNGMPQGVSGNVEAVTPFPQGYSPMTRVPQRQSTMGPYAYPSQHEAFGAQLEYNLSWMPKDINLSELLDQTTQPTARFRRFEQKINPISTHLFEQPQDPNANPLLLAECEKVEAEETNKEKIKSERAEMLCEWFDKTIKYELDKRRDKSFNDNSNLN